MSRIEENSIEYRNALISRNLYTPTNEYDIENSELSNVINFISREIINPGNSFDLSNTIFGRVIGPQTPLTIIGRNELLRHKALDVKTKLRTRLVPTIRFNSKFKSFKDILTINQNVDYSITVDTSTKPIDVFREAIGNFTSFANPVNPIRDNIKFIDNYIYNSNLLIQFTGSGQKHSIESNLGLNQFYPNHIGLDINNGKYYSYKNYLYNYSESFSNIKKFYGLNFIAIPVQRSVLNNYESNFNYLDTLNLSGIRDVNDIDDITLQKTVTWGNDDLLPNPDDTFGLLSYTKNIFNELNKLNKATNNRAKAQIIDIKGNKHFNGSVFNQNTSDNQYGYGKIKNRGNGFKGSVMESSMKPNIAGDGSENLMFSIENLATGFNPSLYPQEQKGRYGGRFMWFNPYIVNINETSTPDFTSTKFIGRGEPVYTFAGSERTLTVAFKMYTDYDKRLLSINDYNTYQRFINTSEILDQNEINNIRKQVENNINKEDFLNKEIDNITSYKLDYVYNGGIIKAFYNPDESTIDETKNINLDVEILQVIDSILDYSDINNGAKFNILTGSVSSVNGDTSPSESLANQRGNTIKNRIISLIRNNRSENVGVLENIDIINNSYYLKNIEDSTISELFSILNDVKLTSSNIVTKPTLNQNPELVDKLNEEKNDIIDNTVERNNENVNITIEKRLNNNYNLLSSSTFENIKSRIVSPGILSYTAKDLYDRLTFLNQCTRQGASTDTQPNTISNSIFGKPPVIVIRIGDMYFTKAVVSQITIDFQDTNTWDLNKGGNGVQFMSCDIILSVKLIGGSTIEGPTKHILNADSRSYYANSSFTEENYKLNGYVDKEQKVLENKSKIPSSTDI